MRARVSASWILVAAALVGPMPSVLGQAVASGDATPLRVEIVGASVSAGFTDGPLTGGRPDNRTVPLHRVLRGWLDGVDAAVQTRADLLMFEDAEERGKRQIDSVAAREPDLLVAVDFLFWYAHGDVRFDRGAAGAEARARGERFALGLAQLERLHGAMLVGDLPDVHGAAARMIRPSQIPSVEVLAQLNRTLRDWAAQRPNVHLFPLAELVANMKGQGVRLPLQGGELATPPGGLMQGDRLHATRLGMAWLGFRLQAEARSGLGTSLAARLPQRAFDDFVDLCDAEDDVETLRELATAKPAGADAGSGRDRKGN